MLTFPRFSGRLKERTTRGTFTGALFCGMFSQSFTKRCSLMPDNSYYASSAWRSKRQERLDFDGHQCQGCGITRKQLEELSWPSLQVHHKNAGPPDFMYPSFGNEQMSDLLTLCVELVSSGNNQAIIVFTVPYSIVMEPVDRVFYQVVPIHIQDFP